MRLFALILLFNLSISCFAYANKPKALDISKIKDVYYLLASGKGIGKSAFGHSYLRFSYHDAPTLNDPIIEFVADIPDLNNYSLLRGIGLGQNYNARIDMKSYKVAKDYHTITEDRDMISYKFNLTQEQKISLAKKINQLLKTGLNMEYSFFTNNCATIVSNTLSNALGNDIFGFFSGVPDLLPEKLKSLGLISQATQVHLGITKKRERFFDEKFPLDLNHLYVKNLRKQLTSTDSSIRRFAYIKLHLIKEQLSNDESIKLNIFVLQYLNLDTYAQKKQVSQYFRQTIPLLKRIELPSVKLAGDPWDTIKIKSAKFKTLNNSVYIAIHYQHAHETKNKWVKLDNFSYEAGKILYDNEVIYWEFNRDFIADSFFSPYTYLNYEVVSDYTGSNRLIFTLATEREQIEIKSKLNSDDIISLKNGYEIDGIKTPMCASVAILQSRLKTNAIFAPNLPALSKSENMELIKAVMNNYIIVIPGHENLYDFTASFDQEQLAKYISSYHKSNFNFINSARRWFSDTRLTTDNINILQNLIDIGSYPVVHFQIPGKNNLGHAIVISKIIESSKYYHFEAYDPNIGLQKARSDEMMKKLSQKLKADNRSSQISLTQSHFRLRKSDSRLETEGYDSLVINSNDNAKLMISSIDLSYLSLILAATKEVKNQQEALLMASESQKYIFHPIELIQ